MLTFRNKHFIKRDYECMNIVACQALERPNDNWTLCEPDILKGLTKLYIQGDVTFYGYL